MSKDEKCTCNACKNTVFHCQICKFVGFLLPSSSWLLKLPICSSEIVFHFPLTTAISGVCLDCLKGSVGRVVWIYQWFESGSNKGMANNRFDHRGDIRELKKLLRLLQRKRHIKTELCVHVVKMYMTRKSFFVFCICAINSLSI